MSDLPIFPILPQIQTCLATQNNLVLQAEPGAGKSTAVPLALLESDWLQGRKIVMLEPRRLAVRTLAHYLAKQLGEKVGERIGFQIRNEKHGSAKTVLEIVTEGVLTRRLQSDPELSDTALVIFDEFHERSIHADLGLSLCLDVQSALREDLKLLVMSATMDVAAVQAFMQTQGEATQVLSAQGRSFAVDTHFLPQAMTSKHPADWMPILQQLIKKALLETVDQPFSDVLVFLSGQGEIERLQKRLVESLPEETVVLPLYGALKTEQQELALRRDQQGRRKVVLATNIAETSLTLDGIGAVVDSGFARKALYDVSSGMTALQTVRISQASAEQRRGRAGRLAAGKCYRLWSESQHSQLPAFDREEIAETDLSDLCLQLALWGLQDYRDLAWLTPPPSAHYDAAKQLLTWLALLQPNGQLTELGKAALQLGMTPRLAKMVLAAKSVAADLALSESSLTAMACEVAALLSERDVLAGQGAYRPDADLIKRVLALQAYRADRKGAKAQFALQVASVEQVLKNANNWMRQQNVQPVTWSLADLQQGVGILVALAFPDRVAQRRSGKEARYRLSNGKGAMLPQEDALAQEDWLAIAQLDGQRQEGRVYLAAPLALTTLKTVFAEQLQAKAHYDYDAKHQRIQGREQVRFGQLILQDAALAEPDEAAMQACLIEAIQQDFSLLNLSKNHQAWLFRVRWLGQFKADFPDFSEAALLADLDNWLVPYLSGVTSVKALQAINLFELLQARLPYEWQQQVHQEAPAQYTTSSGKRVAIEYTGAAPKVSVVLQEVFGELASPLLAWGQVPLTFELLSPARRPIQVTRDLANFWHTSYFEVRKDMKGRYPKHRWPEEPLNEKPGHSVKSKPKKT